MRHATGHNYRNSSFIVAVAMGQIPRSTELISSSKIRFGRLTETPLEKTVKVTNIVVGFILPF